MLVRVPASDRKFTPRNIIKSGLPPVPEQPLRISIKLAPSITYSFPTLHDVRKLTSVQAI